MKVVAIVGSMRFRKEMDEAERMLARRGDVPMAPTHAFDESKLSHGDMAVLRRLHIAKVQMADRLFVVNVGGYIGEQTKAEIAAAAGRPVEYLEPRLVGTGLEAPNDCCWYGGVNGYHSSGCPNERPRRATQSANPGRPEA